MREDIIAPRFAQSRQPQAPPNMSEDIEAVFWCAGYRVNVARISTKRYRVTFLGNPWKNKLEEDISDDIGEEMDKNVNKWHHWRIQDDTTIPDSWLLTAP